MPDDQLTQPFTSAPALPPAAHARIGPDGFDLLDEVGRGGMGVVHRARDRAIGRDVAVKLLADRFQADGTMARRFEEEAAITGQLQHPGVPPVHRVGTLPDGRPFLVMKLIAGRTLNALLGERADPAVDRGRFLAVFEAVAQTVAYAHANGVVHRDLKPGNVMVGAFGEVQVMDWGTAKVLSGGDPAAGVARADGLAIRSPREAGDLTEAGSAIGTPAYMPPEQAVGAMDRIDRRSDVFGLGAVLCAILTGEPPFAGGTAESARRLAARAALGDAFARLDACGAEPALIALAKRCLSADPADRPADAGEVAGAVADLRADAERRARDAELDRARAGVRVAEQGKRWRVRVVALLVLLGATALAAGFAHWAWSEFVIASRLRDAAGRTEAAEAEARELRAERDRWEGEYRARHADEVRRQYEQAREAFFPDGPTPGPSEDFTRWRIEQAWPAGDRALPAGEGRGNQEIADRFRFAARLHLSLGEADRAVGLRLAALSHYLRLAEADRGDLVRMQRVADGYLELDEAARASRREWHWPLDSRKQAIEWYDRLIPAAAAAAREPGGDARRDDRVYRAKSALRAAHAGRARALMGEGRYADAMRDWDAVPLGPDSAEVRPGDRRLRTLCLGRLDPGRARAEVEGWVTLIAAEEAGERAGADWQRLGIEFNDPDGPPVLIPDPKDDRGPAWRDRLRAAGRIRQRGEALYDAACVVSAVSPKLPTADQEAWAARAVTLLEELRERGYFQRPGRVALLAREPDLDPLCGRADFRLLLARPWPPVAPPPRPVKP